MRKLVIALALILAPAVAVAEEDQDLVIPWGMSVSVGGSVGGFAGGEMRDITDSAAGWNARFVIGTRRFVGFEATYLGGVQGVDAFLLDSDAQLLSTSFVGTVRVNFLRQLVESPVQPYAFAGVGYRRYDLTHVDINLSSVEDQDVLFELPLGIGATYVIKRFQIDLRVSYLPVWDADLIPDAKEGTGLATWNAALQVGYEF